DGKGVLSVPAGGFPDALAEIRQRLGDKPLLLAGMVGSNRGWKEAPYVPCPAGMDELVSALVRPSEREAIVPGVSYVGDGRAAVRCAVERDILPAELFSVRARVLLGEARKEDAPSYASGLLIGTDVRIGLCNAQQARVVVMGKPELTRLYAAAIAEMEREAI